MLNITRTLNELDELAGDIAWETPQSGLSLKELLATLRVQIEKECALRAHFAESTAKEALTILETAVEERYEKLANAPGRQCHMAASYLYRSWSAFAEAAHQAGLD